MSPRLITAFAFGLLFTLNAVAQDPAEQVDEAQVEEAQIDEAKRADVRRLMILTGAGDMGKQVVTRMISQFRTQAPNVPQEFWDKFAAKVSSDELIEMTVPVYEKYFSHDDIKELIEFYESPIGRKLVKAQPMIIRDSMEIGSQWGRNLAQQIVQELRARQQPQPNN